MFTVKSYIPDEHTLSERLGSMRQWLDHQRFEPATFRYTFKYAGLLLDVEFLIEAEAAAFAAAFNGQVHDRVSTGAVEPAKAA
jgi:hypothetical protein